MEDYCIPIETRQSGSPAALDNGGMSAILIVHSSFDGQTERIAARIAGVLQRSGHQVEVRPVDAHPSVSGFDAVIVGGAVRIGTYARALRTWAREMEPALRMRPNAFFSVCLSAAGPHANLEEAQRCVDKFKAQSDWEPHDTRIFGGALPYRRYNMALRLMMRFIVGRAGGDTDTSRDYEYTDWDAVEGFARGFARRVALVHAA